jgi:biopolymer transport protein ExbD
MEAGDGRGGRVVNYGRRENRKFSPERVRLPLVALLDVILFLLLYFIVAGSLAPPEGEQPSSLKTDRAAASKGADLQPQILLVDTAAGAVRFRIGERILGDKQSLITILARLPKESGIVVRVADAAPVEAASTALQACMDAGFSKVSYVAPK